MWWKWGIKNNKSHSKFETMIINCQRTIYIKKINRNNSQLIAITLPEHFTKLKNNETLSNYFRNKKIVRNNNNKMSFESCISCRMFMSTFHQQTTRTMSIASYDPSSLWISAFFQRLVGWQELVEWIIGCAIDSESHRKFITIGFSVVIVRVVVLVRLEIWPFEFLFCCDGNLIIRWWDYIIFRLNIKKGKVHRISVYSYFLSR